MYCSPSSSSPLQSHPSLQYSAFSSPVAHPLLKLMSLSATLPPPSSSSSSSSSYEAMLLKGGHQSPVPIPSPNNGQHPESPKSSAATQNGGDHHTSSSSSSTSSYTSSVTNNNNNNNTIKEDLVSSPPPQNKDDDADEVLSIGGNDEADTTTTDEVTVVDADMEDAEKTILLDGEEDDNDDDTFSQKSHISQTSSLPASSSSSSSTGRVRKYSSEDCFSIKSLCSPASSSNNHNPICNGGVHSPPEDVLRRTSSSLLFSIANILRPDFGSSPSPFVPQKRSTKSPPRPHYLGGGELYKPYGFLGGHNTNPIDLSRSQDRQTSYPGLLDKISSSSPPEPGTKRSSSSNYQHHHKSKKSHGNSGGDRDRIKSMGQSHNPHSKSNHIKSSNLTNAGTTNNSSKSPSVTPLPNPKEKKGDSAGNGQTLWPAWVYCTRYSDRPSSGRSPRARRERKSKEKEVDEKRPRTAFTAEQLSRLKKEFDENRYLTEKRRQDLARELRLHENQIKIWFQNKRAKLKKASGTRGGLALQLMAQGLYNHSTIPKSGGEEDDSDE